MLFVAKGTECAQKRPFLPQIDSLLIDDAPRCQGEFVPFDDSVGLLGLCLKQIVGPVSLQVVGAIPIIGAQRQLELGREEADRYFGHAENK